jgi:hypothetical protein
MVLWGFCGSLRLRGIGSRGRRTILPRLRRGWTHVAQCVVFGAAMSDAAMPCAMLDAVLELDVWGVRSGLRVRWASPSRVGAECWACVMPDRRCVMCRVVLWWWYCRAASVVCAVCLCLQKRDTRRHTTSATVYHLFMCVVFRSIVSPHSTLRLVGTLGCASVM